MLKEAYNDLKDQTRGLPLSQAIKNRQPAKLVETAKSNIKKI